MDELNNSVEHHMLRAFGPLLGAKRISNLL